MIKDYVNEENLQVAMTEYDSEMDLDHVVKTQSGDQIGTVTQVYNNTTGAGEQVYAVVKNPKKNAEDVQEITFFYVILWVSSFPIYW